MKWNGMGDGTGINWFENWCWMEVARACTSWLPPTLLMDIIGMDITVSFEVPSLSRPLCHN